VIKTLISTHQVSSHSLCTNVFSNPRGYDGARLSLYYLSHIFAHFGNISGLKYDILHYALTCTRTPLLPSTGRDIIWSLIVSTSRSRMVSYNAKVGPVCFPVPSSRSNLRKTPAKMIKSSAYARFNLWSIVSESIFIAKQSLVRLTLNKCAFLEKMSTHISLDADSQ
jgi:hypothetical protein